LSRDGDPRKARDRYDKWTYRRLLTVQFHGDSLSAQLIETG
jgi:hypothetical protein